MRSLAVLLVVILLCPTPTRAQTCDLSRISFYTEWYPHHDFADVAWTWVEGFDSSDQLIFRTSYDGVCEAVRVESSEGARVFVFSYQFARILGCQGEEIAVFEGNDWRDWGWRLEFDESANTLRAVRKSASNSVSIYAAPGEGMLSLPSNPAPFLVDTVSFDNVSGPWDPLDVTGIELGQSVVTVTTAQCNYSLEDQPCSSENTYLISALDGTFLDRDWPSGYRVEPDGSDAVLVEIPDGEGGWHDLFRASPGGEVAAYSVGGLRGSDWGLTLYLGPVAGTSPARVVRYAVDGTLQDILEFPALDGDWIHARTRQPSVFWVYGGFYLENEYQTASDGLLLLTSPAVNRTWVLSPKFGAGPELLGELDIVPLPAFTCIGTDSAWPQIILAGRDSSGAATLHHWLPSISDDGHLPDPYNGMTGQRASYSWNSDPTEVGLIGMKTYVGGQYLPYERGKPYLEFIGASGRHYVFDGHLDLLSRTVRVDPMDRDDPPSISTPSFTKLHGSTPNPFNPSTQIRFELARDGKVAVEVFDVAGRRVIVLFDGHLDAGLHSIPWGGRDANGLRAASGVYFVRLATDGKVHSSRLTLLK